MNNPILSVITILGLVVVSAHAGSDSGQETNINWGKSVQGVQLSITMTNNVFQISSSSTVESVITNSSTNAITVDISAPTIHFGVYLTNDTGKSYHVTPLLKIREPGRLVTINPDGEQSESIPVIFEDNIEPGNYTLKAKRTFSSSDGNFTLESNSIKVTIIK
jgi:hypothetical protein